MNPSFFVDIDAVIDRVERYLGPAKRLPHADEMLARFDEVDRRLVAKGFPPTSPWWRETIERWYRSGKRQAVLRVGRRGGKSSSLSRLGVVEALYGDHTIPPGDIGMVAVVSTDRPEAAKRLHTIKTILKALGVAYRWNGAEKQIELREKPVAFRVYTASIAGVSGFTSIFVFLDEVAKWRDKETGANPATEVIRSIRPTMATMPNAKIVLSSSPMSMLDAHYDAYAEGETALQIVAHAPTWIANPTVSEERTREDEPDESTHAREYGAVPQAANDSSLISERLYDVNVRRVPQLWDLPPAPGHFYVATMDPATRRHAWTFAITTKGLDGRRKVAMAREWRPKPGVPLRPKTILMEIRELMRPYGLRVVHTDQHAVDHLRDLLPEGLHLVEVVWTQPEIQRACEHLLKLCQSEAVEFHPDPQVKLDVMGIMEVFTRNGRAVVFAEGQGRHSDYAPTIAMAVDDARWGAKDVPAAPATEADARKVEFLERRRKEREHAERYGRKPATHRMRPMSR